MENLTFALISLAAPSLYLAEICKKTKNKFYGKQVDSVFSSGHEWFFFATFTLCAGI